MENSKIFIFLFEGNWMELWMETGACTRGRHGDKWTLCSSVQCAADKKRGYTSHGNPGYRKIVCKLLFNRKEWKVIVYKLDDALSERRGGWELKEC